MTTGARPVGAPVTDFVPPPHPRGVTLAGHFAWLRPLRPADDAPLLYPQLSDSPWLFDYLGEPPPGSVTALDSLLAVWAARADCEIFAIGRTGEAAPLGYACLMSVSTTMGDIEIGNVNLSPAMQRRPLATEAFSLMLGWCFKAGYRRVVWKCNALNAPSRRAAQRLGFSFEGLFRKHLIVKGLNRDTAWFAIIDDDWPLIAEAHATWLAPANFDPAGRQVQSLTPLTQRLLFRTDPDV